MRTLFFSSPLYGHIIPQIPLARAFRDRGDTVAFVTAREFAPLFAAERITLLPAGPTGEGVMEEMVCRTGVDPVEAGQTGSPETVVEMFAGVRVDLGFLDALAHAREFEPDLIVAEALDFVGPMVADALGVPYATMPFGPALPSPFAELFAAEVARACERRGLRCNLPDWYLDPCPPSLQCPDWQAPKGRIGLRPEAFRRDGAAGARAALAGERTGRARVLATFGTLFADTCYINSLLTGLLAQDFEIRLTLGLTAAEADFSGHYDRVEYFGFTPLDQLLDDVDVVLTVGGAGTVLGALSRGLPLVVTPQGADQPINASRVAAAGAGITFPPGRADPGSVAEAVETVLTRPEYRQSAQRIAAEIRELPAADEVADRLAAALA